MGILNAQMRFAKRRLAHPGKFNLMTIKQEPEERRRRIAKIAYALAERRGFAGDSDEAFEDWSEAVRIVDQSPGFERADAKPASKELTRAMRRVTRSK
jgi:hypothetical protein